MDQIISYFNHSNFNLIIKQIKHRLEIYPVRNKFYRLEIMQDNH